jgi:hypothetical protein
MGAVARTGAVALCPAEPRYEIVDDLSATHMHNMPSDHAFRRSALMTTQGGNAAWFVRVGGQTYVPPIPHAPAAHAHAHAHEPHTGKHTFPPFHTLPHAARQGKTGL